MSSEDGVWCEHYATAVELDRERWEKDVFAGLASCVSQSQDVPSGVCCSYDLQPHAYSGDAVDSSRTASSSTSCPPPLFVTVSAYAWDNFLLVEVARGIGAKLVHGLMQDDGWRTRPLRMTLVVNDRETRVSVYERA